MSVYVGEQMDAFAVPLSDDPASPVVLTEDLLGGES